MTSTRAKNPDTGRQLGFTYRDTIPHCYYLIDIFMIFDLYYISCTYVKPMNCMVLGNKQYNTSGDDVNIFIIETLRDPCKHVK